MMYLVFSDRRPPGVGRGRGRGREDGSGRQPKGIGRGMDDGGRGVGGRGRGGPSGKPGGKGMESFVGKISNSSFQFKVLTTWDN